MRRHAVSEENVRSDGGAGADYRIAAHHGRAGVDRDMILDRRMTLLAAQSRALRRASGR